MAEPAPDVAEAATLEADVKMPRAPVEMAAPTEGVLAEATIAGGRSQRMQDDDTRPGRLTGTVGRAVGDDTSSIRGTRTCLVGTVADTVAEVAFRAVAASVALGAAKVGRGDVQHVFYACLLV